MSANHLRFSNTGNIQAWSPYGQVQGTVGQTTDIFAEFDRKLAQMPPAQRKQFEDLLKKAVMAEASSVSGYCPSIPFENYTTSGFGSWIKDRFKDATKFFREPKKQLQKIAKDPLKWGQELIKKQAKNIADIATLPMKAVEIAKYKGKDEKKKEEQKKKESLEQKYEQKARSEIKKAEQKIAQIDRELKQVRALQKQSNRLLSRATSKRGIYLNQCPTNMKRLATQVVDNKAYAICASKPAKKRASAFSRVMKAKGRVKGIYLPEPNPSNLFFNSHGLM